MSGGKAERTYLGIRENGINKVFISMRTLETISTKDIFNCTPEERKLIIEEGVEVIMVEAEVFSQRTGETFSTAVNLILQNLYKNIKIADEQENYELSYYLNELTWATLKKIEEINELKRYSQLIQDGIQNPNNYL